MEAFVKSFATYRTVKKAAVISSALVVDSLDRETTAVTVVGTGINRSDTGSWLILENTVYQIYNVKPQSDRTLLTLVAPLDAFSRPLELEAQPNGQTIGGFVAQMLDRAWANCDDPVYAMPYLTVSNSDSTAYVAPELDNSGCFSLAAYCRLVRKGYRVTVRFADSGSHLSCTINRTPAASRQVSFEDGRSQLQSVDYSSSGVSKITVLCNVQSGDIDESGEPIIVRSRSTWYLAEDGSISQTIPARRASGEWTTISVNNPDQIQAKVIETFAKNKANHKLEFWSVLDLAVQDDCTFLVYGELLHSYISYKRKSSEDKRYYYKSGELATTATEKLRGVMK